MCRCSRCGRFTRALYVVWNKYTYSIDSEVCWGCLPDDDRAREEAVANG